MGRLSDAKLYRTDPDAYWLEFAARKKKAAKKEKGTKDNPKCNKGNYQCRGAKGVACIPMSRGCKTDPESLDPVRRAFIQKTVDELRKEGARPKFARIGKALGAERVQLSPEQYEKALSMNISGRDLAAGTVPLAKLQALGIEPTPKTPKPPKVKAIRDRVLPDGTPMTRDKLTSFVDALYDGDATPEGIKKNWESFNDSRDSLSKEFNGFTFKQLKEMYPAATLSSYSDIKKGDFINKVLDGYEGVFNPNTFISYDVFDRSGESRRQAYRKAVESWTPEKIAKQAEDYKKQEAERQARRDAAQKALNNPETLADFKTFISSRGFDQLTPEQKRTYDALSADASRTARREQEQAAKARQVASTTLPSGVSIDVRKGWHAKKQQDTYVATLGDRVDRDTYNDLLTRAKSLGGYYSSYNKGGAVPGFQFPTEEAAKKFASMGQEKITSPNDAASRQKNASERLRELADRSEERANDALNKERLANTVRRVNMARHAEAEARSSIALAQTMRAIADAVESGSAKYLDRVSTMADVSQLRSAARSAQYLGWKSQKGIKLEDYKGSIYDADFVRYPLPTSVRRYALDRLEEKAVPGIQRALATLKALDGGAIKNQKELDALRKILPHLDSHDRKATGIDDYDRLQRLDIKTESEYREAIREFIRIKQDPAPRDAIKELERDLVGRKIPGYFPTPPAVVDQAMSFADVREGQRVLEPSAGKGNIAERLRETGASVDTIEINPTLAGILEAKGFEPSRDDFLSFRGGNYDRIVMNPPFENGQDIDHVRHAYDLLAPGGRIVAIMSEGAFFRGDSKASGFREWADGLGGFSERLPEGSFKNSENPTGVNTRIFVLEKSQ